MLSLNTLKTVLREYGIHPSKRLGQNFLIDQNIKKKIISAIVEAENSLILEIGPGTGAITEDLCKIGKKVIAIEKDSRLYNFLTNKIHLGNLELVHADFLKYKFVDLQSKVIVIGNLPYYITALILTHLLDNRHHISSIYISVQTEVAERILAMHGSKAYSPLSCYVQFYGEPKILFRIPRHAFFPVPEVDSCFLSIRMFNDYKVFPGEKILFRIIRSAFQKRRKTIINALSGQPWLPDKKELAEILAKIGISETQRPETISLEQFIHLSELIAGD